MSEDEPRLASAGIQVAVDMGRGLLMITLRVEDREVVGYFTPDSSAEIRRRLQAGEQTIEGAGPAPDLKGNG